MSAAFVGRSVGLGFCTRGAGGGGAAVCGAAASLDRPCGAIDKGRGDALGSGSGWGVELLWTPDMRARREITDDERHGVRSAGLRSEIKDMVARGSKGTGASLDGGGIE